MIGLGLLFAWLHLIHRPCLQRLTFLFLLGQSVKISLVAILRKGQPVHHVTTVVNLEEGLQFAADTILHLCAQREMQRLTGNGSQLIGNVVDIIVDEDRCLVDGQLLTAGILSEPTVVSYQVGQVLCARLHSEQDRTVHQGDVLRYVGQVFDAVVHGEGDVNDVALLPLAVDGDIR